MPLPPEPTGPKPQPKKFGMDAWAQVRMHTKDDRDADWIAKELGLDRQHVCYAMLADKYSKYSRAADRADIEDLHRWRNGETTT